MRIYLDHNATTPPHPEVVETCSRVARDVFGNASSVHACGAAARAELARARARVAALFGAEPEEVIFTAGATEANNLALRGGAHALADRGRHLVTTAAEHPSVLEPAAALEAAGWRVTRVPVDADGLVDPDALAEALEDDTVLVSILWANNETGVVQPLERLAEPVKARGIPLHVDATQALGKLPVDLARLPVDLVSASAHKLNGPKGTGCLVQRRGTPLAPWIRGGPQERRLRGGTHDVPGAAGFGVACELARRDLRSRALGYAELRDRLWEGLRAKIPRVRRNGCAERVLPNTLNVELEGAAGDVLLEALDGEGVSVSAGAACASGAVTPSHVLTAMGRTPRQARASLRFSVGLGNDAAQIDHVLGVLPDLVTRVRELAAP